MTRYSHQFLIAFTVENEVENWNYINEKELVVGLAKRLAEIIEHDGIEAFQHNDTEEV
jgi:hypothetical protein